MPAKPSLPLHAFALLALLATRATATPAPSGMAPAVVVPGTTVVVSGSDLVQDGRSISVSYRKKYLAPGETSTGIVGVTALTETSASFAAPANAVPNSFRLRYRDATPAKGNPASLLDRPDTYAIPGTLFVKEPPVLTGVDAILAVTASAQPGRLLQPGAGRTFAVFGRNLVPAPGSALAFTIGATSYSAGAVAKYDTTHNGRDVLTITVGEPAATFLGTATVTTSAGSATAANWMVARRPRLTAIEELAANGTVVGPASGRLVRGRRYQIRGTDLAFPAAPPFSLISIVAANPSAALRDSNVSSTRTIITFPANHPANSSTLRLNGPGGELDLGTFSVSDPGALPPPLAGLVISPTPTVHGTTLTATVSFAGGLTPGLDVGGLEITSSDNTRSPGLPRTVPITANPMTVALPTKVRDQAETRTYTVRLTRVTSVADQLSTPVSLTAPSFTALSPATATVPGGAPLELAATFDFPAGAQVRCGSPPFSSPDLAVEVSTSNDALVQLTNGILGVSRRVCVEHPSQSIELITQPVASNTNVVVTVEYQGTTRTATLTLTPPAFSAMTVNRAALTSMQGATGTLALSSPMPGAFALLSSSDPAVSVPAKVTFPTGGASMTFAVTTLPVSSARAVTLSAIVNGVTRTTVLQLNPLEFQGLGFSPATVRSGSNTAATLTLNTTVDLPFTVSLASSDPTVATVPASVAFAPGQNAAVFSVQTIAGLTANRDVTITATYAVTLPNGSVVTTTRSAALAVTP